VILLGTEQLYEKQDVQLVCRDTDCSIYRVGNDTGDGTITAYSVFEGVALQYNDFHIKSTPAREQSSSNVLEIQHCREGRIEWEVENDVYLYLATGDLLIDNMERKNQNCSLPLSHFHGITIVISLDDISLEVRTLFELFKIDLQMISDSFKGEKPFIMRAERSIEHIFSELYQIPKEIRNEYFKVKILELLLFLKMVDTNRDRQERPYFYKTQVEKVKAIMAFMTSNPDKHYTIQQLSEMYDISISALKSCFKGVYGAAIFTFMKNYRMDLAAKLLSQTDKTVTEIAGDVGYTNCSKFSEAFKKTIGQTPMEYRKLKI